MPHSPMEAKYMQPYTDGVNTISHFCTPLHVGKARDVSLHLCSHSHGAWRRCLTSQAGGAADTQRHSKRQTAWENVLYSRCQVLGDPNVSLEQLCLLLSHWKHGRLWWHLCACNSPCPLMPCIFVATSTVSGSRGIYHSTAWNSVLCDGRVSSSSLRPAAPASQQDRVAVRAAAEMPTSGLNGDAAVDWFYLTEQGQGQCIKVHL